MHEYGHALHHVELGGIYTTDCGEGHGFNLPSGYQCAFSEGFAGYVARAWAGTAASILETFHSDSLPAKVEGNFAALLHDLVDSNQDSNDSTDYSISYVLDVLSSCTVSGTTPRDDVADFIWCMENRVNSSVHATYFPGLTAPSSVSETATEPQSWDADDVRSSWIQNLG